MHTVNNLLIIPNGFEYLIVSYILECSPEMHNVVYLTGAKKQILVLLNLNLDQDPP